MLGRKFLAVSLLTAVSVGVMAADSAPRATTSMLEMMNRIILPASNAVFYAASELPDTDEGWRELENHALVLAESANLLLIEGYRQDSAQWLTDTLLMRDASIRAFQAAQERDEDALIDLNNDLYESCESCHDVTR